jgi:proton-coupled amino acid transporter
MPERVFVEFMVVKSLFVLFVCLQILPIEASMEGNRHNFVKFLFGAVATLAFVLAFFGIMGYLRFGLEIEQMINANIPNGQWLGIMVNSCLCIGVLLTFPLMMYPVIELAELYIFGNSKIFYI